MRYGHPATNECSICYMPDSCTHITKECPNHEALRISRHNAACQLILAAIRKTTKGDGALYSAPDLVLVMTDTDTQPMTTGESLESLSSTTEENNPFPNPETPHHDWLAPLPTTEDIRRRRHTDVSQDPSYNQWGLSAIEGDAECTTAPRRIQDWLLPPGRVSDVVLSRAWHNSGPHLCKWVPRLSLPRPNLFQKETMHPHHRGDRLLHEPRLRH